MNFSTFALAGCLTVASATASLSSTVYSFTVGPSATIEIFGLEDNGLGQSASEIVVSFGDEVYFYDATDIFLDNFDVVGGIIDETSYQATLQCMNCGFSIAPDGSLVGPNNFGQGVIGNGAIDSVFGLDPNGDTLQSSIGNMQGPRLGTVPMPAVPLPAGGLLLLSGLLGILGLRRLKAQPLNLQTI